MQFLNNRVICIVVSCIFLLIAIFFCYIFYKYPYSTASECRDAETQLGIFSNVAFYYFSFNKKQFEEFIEWGKMPYKIDVWGHECLLQKDKNKVLLRSFGKNGIDNEGNVDDITVIIEQRKDELFKTKKIAGYTFFRYWKIFPKSWLEYEYSYDDKNIEKKIP